MITLVLCRSKSHVDLLCKPIGRTTLRPHGSCQTTAVLQKKVMFQSGDSWMYPYQRTPYQNSLYKPYIVDIYGL